MIYHLFLYLFVNYLERQPSYLSVTKLRRETSGNAFWESLTAGYRQWLK